VLGKQCHLLLFTMLYGAWAAQLQPLPRSESLAAAGIATAEPIGCVTGRGNTLVLLITFW